MKWATLLLWFGPPLLLLLGFVALIRYLYKRRKLIAPLPLTEDERRQAQLLLSTGGEGESK